MPSYVMLLNFTEQGSRNIKETLDRAGAFHNAVEKAGGKVREHVYTLGEYDVVMVTEFPDDETAAGVMVNLASLGNVRSKTMRAFTDDEASAIMSLVG